MFVKGKNKHPLIQLLLTRQKVVSIGVNLTFKVIFIPFEYIPTMSKRLHFFGSGFFLFYQTSSIFFCTFQVGLGSAAYLDIIEM